MMPIIKAPLNARRFNSGKRLMYLATRVLLLCLLTAGVFSPAQAAIIVTPIGAPAYTPTDFHLFSAPIGTAADGYAEFGAVQQLLLPPPNHEPNPVLGIGPGTPHPGPYTSEFANGVSANGFVDASSFTVPQYSNGNGVYLVFMLVPGVGAPVGSSPDFSSGPILSDTIFPLKVAGQTLTNGVAGKDTLGDFEVPPLSSVAGFESVDGHSHIPFFFVDNFDFADQPIPATYDYQISITDQAGNGYAIDAIFTVSEPPSWVLAGSGLGGLILTMAGGVRRRQTSLSARTIDLSEPAKE